MKRFAHITDVHLKEDFPVENNVNAEKNWQCILDDIKKEQITDIVFGGDIGDPSAHEYFFKSLDLFNVKIVLGNHDEYKYVAKYTDGNTAIDNALSYAEEDTFYKYLFLDTSTEKITTQQLDWMNEELQTDKSVIIFIHHPVLQVNVAADKLYSLENRGLVKECLLNSRKDITLFCGHYHLDDERREDNARQLITPAASYQTLKFTDEFLVDASQFGYRIIELDENNIQSRLKMFKNEMLL